MKVTRAHDDIQLYYSSNNNRISENSIATNNNDGIVVYESSNKNNISGNTVRNNLVGINIGNFAYNNSITENIVTNNGNTGINVESSSNTVSGNNVSGNNGTGIYITESSNNTIFGNSIADNLQGISLTYGSGNNTLSRNNLARNDCGIRFYAAYNDSIFHNNFIDNACQIEGEYFGSIWDDGYPSGGNYWSNYTGVDVKNGSYQNETGSDGIGDTPYIIDANNIDHYPLVVPTAIPEFPSFLVLPLFIFFTMLSVVFLQRRIPRRQKNSK